MSIAVSWDDPFHEGRSDAWLGERKPVDLLVIRERQGRLVPFIEELRRMAAEVMGDTKNRGLLSSERELVVAVDYRMPDYPQILQKMAHAMTDHVVVVPVVPPVVGPVYDRLAPAQPVDRVQGQGDLKRYYKLQGLSGVGEPEQVRIVLPRLLEFVKNWINKIDGTIYDVQFAARRGETSYQRVQVSSLRH
jgi:uncharacterized protein Usg